MTGRLIHYSRQPLEGVNDGGLIEMKAQPLQPHAKPAGLWVSVEGEDDWLSWCRAERFAPDRFGHATLVELEEGPNVLRLATAGAIDDFTEEFGRDFRIGPVFTWKAIDWPAVSARYDGIVIAPYQWSRRLHERTSWYYTWDCASGCIWRARAVARLEPVEAPEVDWRDDSHFCGRGEPDEEAAA